MVAGLDDVRFVARNAGQGTGPDHRAGLRIDQHALVRDDHITKIGLRNSALFGCQSPAERQGHEIKGRSPCGVAASLTSGPAVRKRRAQRLTFMKSQHPNDPRQAQKYAGNKIPLGLATKIRDVRYMLLF